MTEELKEKPKKAKAPKKKKADLDIRTHIIGSKFVVQLYIDDKAKLGKSFKSQDEAVKFVEACQDDGEFKA